MPRLVDRLTETKIRTLSKPGLHPDGRGLYLQVRNSTRSWVFRFTLNGRTRDMGLGALASVGLVAARTKAAECRSLRARGIDPIEHHRAATSSIKVATASAGPTFREFAETCIDAWAREWKNAKHAAQWRSTLEQYAYPIIGDMGIADIGTKDVLAILEPHWREKTETMQRVRGRIERILAAASVKELRTGNPAVWRGHLDAAGLGQRPPAVHHPALPYAEIPQFLRDLRPANGVSPLALEFLILTAARTSEVTESRWAEVDFGAATWTIPAARMKAGREHIVPLPDRALQILSSVKPLRDLGEGYIFPGLKPGRPLSNMVFLKLLKRMRRSITAHGFRSTFRDWAGDRTDFDKETIEFALAHGITNKTEKAYRRGTAVEKRRELMNAWAAYCTSAPTENVVQLRA